MNNLKRIFSSIFKLDREGTTPHFDVQTFTSDDIGALFTSSASPKSQPPEHNDLQRFVKAEEYALLHIAEHLRSSGQYERLYQLLLHNQAWSEAKFVRLFSDASYLQDLDIAVSTLPDSKDEFQTLTLILLHAAKHAISSKLTAYNDIHLRTLAKMGRQFEALGYARLRTNPRARLEGLLAIYHVLCDSGIADMLLLEEMHSLAHDLQDPSADAIRFELIQALQSAGYFDIALEMIHAIASETTRAALLGDLVTALGVSEKFELALNLSAQVTDKVEYIKALCGIARAMNRVGFKDASSVMGQAVAEANLIVEDHVKVKVLVAIIPILVQMDNESADALMGKALHIARNLPDIGLRLTALSSILMIMSPIQMDQNKQILDEMYQNFQRIEHQSLLLEKQSKASHKKDFFLASFEDRQYSSFRDWASGFSIHVMEAFIQAGDKRVPQIAEAAIKFVKRNSLSTFPLEQLMQCLLKKGWSKTALRLALAEKEIEQRFNERLVILAKSLVALDHLQDCEILNPLEEAIQNLDRHRDAGRASALAYLAIALSKAGYKRAKLLANAAMQTTIGSGAYPSKQAEDALILAQGGYFDEAITILTRLTRTVGGTVEVEVAAETLAKIAELMANLGDERALPTLRKSVELLQSNNAVSFSKDAALQSMSEQMIKNEHIAELAITAIFVLQYEKRAQALSLAALAAVGRENASPAYFIDEALKSARSVPLRMSRSKALGYVAVAMAKAGDARALSIFDEVIRNATNGEENGQYELYDVINSLVEVGWVDKALQTLELLKTYQKKRDLNYKRVLRNNDKAEQMIMGSIGGLMDQSTLDSAIHVIVLAFLKLNEIDTALEIVNQFHTPEAGYESLVAIIQALAKMRRWKDAEAIVLQIENLSKREAARREMIFSIRENISEFDSPEESIQTVQTLQDVSLRIQILAVYVKVKPSAHPKTIDALWKSACNLKPGSDGMVDALCAVIEALPATRNVYNAILVDMVLHGAETLNEPARKVMAWCRIAKALYDNNDNRAASLVKKALDELIAGQEVTLWSTTFQNIAELLNMDEQFAKILSAVDRFPDNANRETILRVVLDTLLKLKRGNEAIEVLSKMHPPSPQEYSMTGEIFMWDKRIEVALSLLKTCELPFFMETVVKWGNIMAHDYPGIEAKILRELIRIAGWFDPYWQNIHEAFSLAPPAEG